MKTDNPSTNLSFFFSAERNSCRFFKVTCFVFDVLGQNCLPRRIVFLDVKLTLSKPPSPVDNILGVNPLRSLNISY